MNSRPPQLKNFLQVQNLHKVFHTKFQSIHVLKDISFVINKGEFVIIFGPSGCGKSTLLHTILGLEMPSAGKVVFYGKDFYSFSADERADFRKHNLGMVYQQSNWIKSLNILENVSLPLVLLGNAKQRAMRIGWQLLAQVGLSDKGSYYAAELSAGQQQRIAMARAMLNDPEIIIADEPTGNLDYKAGFELMKLFTNLQKQGKTVIMVTHDIQYLHYADRVLRMFDGKIIDDIQMKGMTEEKIKKLVIEEPKVSFSQPSVPLRFQEKDIDTKYKEGEFSTGGFLSNVRRGLKRSVKVMINLLVYLFVGLISRIGYGLDKKISLKFNSSVFSKFNKKTNSRDSENHQIREVDLIELAIRNLKLREIRTLITVGGMALGIGFIVFLLSIGYGLENLVIKEVVGLNERRELSVYPAESAGLYIDSAKISDFEKIDKVDAVYPIVNAAADVKFEGSNFESIVVATKPEYLSNLDTKIVEGRTISDNLLIDADVQTEVAKTDEIDLERIEEEFVQLPQTGVYEAVISTSFLKVLGIGNKEVLDRELNLSFAISSKLAGSSEKIITNFVTYSVVGVVDDDNNVVAYINLDDIQSLGLDRHSEARVVVSSIDDVPEVRSQISGMGFKTYSLLDVTSRIQTLFSSLRQILLVLGLFAFSIASLGMFNTLTVSLLERTREIGLMKAMGMKSNEIFDLFLTESLSMSMLGGLMGLLVGFSLGKLLSLILTFASLSNGLDYLEVSIIPLSVVVIIIILSAIIGVLTGLYPSLRATKISALNALRYE